MSSLPRHWGGCFTFCHLRKWALWIPGHRVSLELIERSPPMARKQAQGGSRGRKGPSEKPKGKVGSNPAAADGIGGKRDFGVPESDTIERSYTSANTRASDPGAAQPHAGEDGGRVAGVGGNASGRGASSGGDIDTDIIGVGTGGSGIS